MAQDLYTFLLVDDEEIIREGISENIDWESEGFRFLPPCSNGLEAVDCIDRLNPDVVLTDICMPHKDGLEVAEYIHEFHPGTITLILSGYDDFEYAQKALSSQVMDYILKPISSRTLKKHLGQIREALKLRDKNRRSREHMLELLQKSREAVRDRYLLRLISGRLQNPDSEMEDQELAFLNQCECFGVLCLEMDMTETSRHESELTQDLLFLTMEEASLEVLSNLYDSARISTPENRMVIILGRHKPEALSQELKSIAEKIINRIQFMGNGGASAGIGLVVKNRDDIFTSYRQAVTALQNRLIAGNNGIFLFVEDQYSDLNKRILLNKCCENIRRDIRVGRKEDILRTSDKFISILQEGGIPSKQARLEIVKFISVILDVLEEIGIAGTVQKESTLADKLYDLMGLSSLDGLKQGLYVFFDEVSQILKEKRISFPKKKIQEIIRYLEVHYADPVINAESVAQKFFISTGYLTKLFRQNEDKGFLEYLNHLKLERSKELLKTTDLKNYEIAEAVGFRDPHYFSSSFKKYQGQTPSEFRSGL